MAFHQTNLSLCQSIIDCHSRKHNKAWTQQHRYHFSHPTKHGSCYCLHQHCYLAIVISPSIQQVIEALGALKVQAMEDLELLHKQRLITQLQSWKGMSIRRRRYLNWNIGKSMVLSEPFHIHEGIPWWSTKMNGQKLWLLAFFEKYTGHWYLVHLCISAHVCQTPPRKTIACRLRIGGPARTQTDRNWQLWNHGHTLQENSQKWRELKMNCNHNWNLWGAH